MSGVQWKGLMEWSTKYHDGTKESQFKMMTPEDRAYLEAAMESALGQIEDPNKVFAEAIEQTKASDRTETSVCTALEVIDRVCDDTDVARNAEKLGGIQSLLDLLGVYAGATRVRTLEILALLFSNNTQMQEVGMKRGANKIFIDLFQASSSTSEERSKVFRALSALLRSMESYEDEFLRNDNGAAIIVAALAPDEDSRSREKAASFARSLAATGRLQASDSESITAAIAQLLKADDIAEENLQYRETVASCAGAVVGGASAAAAAELQAALEARLASGQVDEEVEKPSLEEALVAAKSKQ